MVLKKLFTVDSDALGKGNTLFAWQKEGNLLACTGSTRRVVIVDRQGKVAQQIPLQGTTAAVTMEWDSQGEVLAVIQEKSPLLTLYTVATKKTEVVDTGFKEVTFMAWSKGGPHLAVGGNKGQLMLYNRQTQKKNPIGASGHTKAIVSGGWNRHNILAVASEEKIMNLWDAEGTQIETITLKHSCSSIVFADGSDSSSKPGNSHTLCANLNGKSLLLHNYKKKTAPIELKFNSKYGAIASARPFGEGYILVGFASGYVLVVSTHEHELGSEVSSYKSHRDTLVDVAYSKALLKGCAIGDGTIRVFGMEDNKINEQQVEKLEFESLFGAMLSAAWTEDGQILTVGTRNGTVNAFLTRIPVLSDAVGAHVMYLSNLREITVRDLDIDATLCRVPIDVEPAFASIGQGVLGVGMNNEVHYYSYAKSSSKPLGSRTYGGIVDSVKLSTQHTALLVEGRLVVHRLGGGSDAKSDTAKNPQATLPDREGVGRVTCYAMTENFLVYGTSNGHLSMFSLVDFETLVDYKHNGGAIKTLASNTHGTRIAFVDQANAGFVLNPTTEVTTTIENFNPNTKKLIWDPSEYGVLIGVDSRHFTTYCYAPNSRFGPTCEPVCVMDPKKHAPTGKVNLTAVPSGFHAIGAYRGAVSCQMPTGTLAAVSLDTHRSLYSTSKSDGDGFLSNLALNRLTQAANLVTSQDQLKALANKALTLLDIEMAIRAYRLLNQPTVVLCLEKIRHIKEKNILLGHVSMMAGNFDVAQNFFARSSRPILALEMRRDLLQWDHALSLAKEMATEQVPQMSREYAQQLEFKGEYAKALDVYQQGKMPMPKGAKSAELEARKNIALAHNDVCDAGAARCMIRTGNIRGGVQLAQSLANAATVAMECAKILEGLNQFEEAAAMYEQAEQYEKAVSLHITETKNLKAAGRLLPKIKSRNILVMYAKAKETQHQAYGEAEKAYEMAEDWDNVVRIKVEHMNDLHGAYIIVRQTKSADAAAMVAKMCRNKKEYGPAVEFLVMAKKISEALELAQSSDTMTNFEEALLSQTTLKDGVAVDPARKENFFSVAQFYERRKMPLQAGRYFQIAGNFPMALGCFMQSSDAAAVRAAVEVVGKAKSDALTNKLLDYLMGEVDGEVKDPSNIFALYMSLGAFEKASKTSVLIATKEQESGNYREAHRMLVQTVTTLQQKNTRVGNDLRRILLLVHSYLIVKHLISALGDMENATRMLLRVTRNIAKFPLHAATIITTTILQCIKGDFKASAYELACLMIQNEQWRGQMNEKHKKKIESLVRKRNEERSDPPEAMTPCPFCAAPVAETTMDCGACKNALPFCVVTGKHMTTADWSQCPSCKFPALFGPFSKLLLDTPQCPLCEAAVNPNDIAIVRNPDVKAFV